MSFIPRDYQVDLANQAEEKLRNLGMAYLSMEVRTGKTFTSLMAAHQYGVKKVLFLTVSKAIKGIQKDVEVFAKLDVKVMSMDSAHKVPMDHDYELIIVDEAHGLGAFPKRNKRSTKIQILCGDLPVILLSGTPTPESYTQLFHQLTVTYRHPWSQEYKTFYQWARDYVNIKQRMFNGRPYNDYSNTIKEKIQPVIDEYFISFTQIEAGFKCRITEHDVTVPMKSMTRRLIERLKKDKVVQGSTGVILADTPVKMLSKQHQLASGTVILEEGAGTIVIDRSKVKYIRENFPGKKLAIFYKYQAEFSMLKGEFGEDLTTDVEEFQQTDKHIALQIRAGSMGVNLSAADCQVYVSVDFSAKDYIQSRARLQKQERQKVDVYFLLSDCGIDRQVLKTVRNKMDFTSSYFKALFNES